MNEVLSAYEQLHQSEFIALRWHATLYFKVNKPGIQAGRLLCLVEIIAHSPFLESQTVHAP